MEGYVAVEEGGKERERDCGWEVARRRRYAGLRMGRFGRAVTTALLLTAVAVSCAAQGYQENGYACQMLSCPSGQPPSGYPCRDYSKRGREGTHLRLNMGTTSNSQFTTRLVHDKRNATLYGSSFTMQMFVLFADNRSFVAGGTGVTLMSNMGTAGGLNSGWQVVCASGKCCLNAYLKQIPTILQTVCTQNLDPGRENQIKQDQWLHITARYDSTSANSKAKAAIFVNGLKHNEAEWGNKGRGAINYGETVNDWPLFAVGCDPSGPLDSSCLKGRMDEVRLWTMPLNDDQILDTSFETAWRKRNRNDCTTTCEGTAQSCTTLCWCMTGGPTDNLMDIYTRIASVSISSQLALYIKDPQNADLPNLNIMGEPSFVFSVPVSSQTSFTSTNVNAQGPVLFQLQGSEAGLYPVKYIEKDPVLELLPSSRGVLSDVYPRLASYQHRGTDADDVTVVVEQQSVTVLDMRVRDPNYDDVVSIRDSLKLRPRFEGDFEDRATNSEIEFIDGCVNEGLGMSNMRLCDHQYNSVGGDRVGWTSFAGVPGYEGLHNEGSQVPNSILTFDQDSAGWTTDQKPYVHRLDVDNLLMGSNNDAQLILRGRERNQTACRTVNAASNLASQPASQRLPSFLPPYTDSQSRVHLRLVWSHRMDYDWWMPEEGLEYQVNVRSYSRYNALATNTDTSCNTVSMSGGGGQRHAGVCKTLRLGVHAQFAPEFVNNDTYPKPRQERQQQALEETWKYSGDDLPSGSISANAVRHGDSLAVAVGETLEFLVRMQDRNKGDTTVIRVREDPGLPPGLVLQGGIFAQLGDKPQSQVLLPSSYVTSKLLYESNDLQLCFASLSDERRACTRCKRNFRDKYQSPQGDFSPPNYVDRRMTYKPREEHAGAVFRVCFYGETQNKPCNHTGAVGAPYCQGMGLRRYDGASRISMDLCVKIKVVMPLPRLVTPRGDRLFDAIVGCKLEIPLRVVDSSVDGYDKANGKPPTPYKYRIIPTVEGSQACSSSGCGSLAPPLVEGASSGLPRGMVLNGNDNGSAVLTWTPERGQELGDGYRVCFKGRVENILAEYGQLREASMDGTECFLIRVRKCQECVRQGQSLASIARSLHIDWQTLQMYNPFLERPDDIKTGTVIATGPLYTVREGDFLESVAARFLVTPDDLLHTNPDVRLGNATLTVGLNLCVRTHVCNIKCKMHGSVCEADTEADLVEQLARD